MSQHPTIVVIATPITYRDAITVATNIRRHMASSGLTFEDVVSATELDERTVRGIVRGTTTPHARTLRKLADGLGVEVDDLFRPTAQHAPRQFDRATNLLVEGVIGLYAETFRDWSEADFDELYSRFGTGGQLTEEGILATAHAMNDKRDLWRQMSIIFESGEAQLLTEFVDMLYRRATATPNSSPVTAEQTVDAN